jgi:hypothetical protein
VEARLGNHDTYEPVALVGFVFFFSKKRHKNHDKWAPYTVCRVKNRLIGDFSEFYAQSATNCYGDGDEQGRELGEQAGRLWKS